SATSRRRPCCTCSPTPCASVHRGRAAAACSWRSGRASAPSSSCCARERDSAGPLLRRLRGRQARVAVDVTGEDLVDPGHAVRLEADPGRLDVLLHLLRTGGTDEDRKSTRLNSSHVSI